MSDKEMRRSREKAFFEADFTSSADPQRHPSPEERLATAAEYAAYQLGQISKKLTSLIAQIEAQRRVTENTNVPSTSVRE